MHPLLRDPWVAAKIDAAIAPYRDRLTPEQVEIFREKMAWTLETHPAAGRILRAERPRSVVDESGENRINPPGDAQVSADTRPARKAR